MKKVYFFLFLFILVSLPLFSSFSSPTITRVERGEDDERKMYVYFEYETSNGGGDKAEVKLYDENDVLVDSKTVGKSKKLEKKTFFRPLSSGTYYVEVVGIKGDEENKSSKEKINWSYPLYSPEVTLSNVGGLEILVSWNPVAEADGYIVTMNDVEYETKDTEMVFSNLSEGEKYLFSVSSLRGEERKESYVSTKTAKKERDREWNFTRFGQSTKDNLNTHAIIDSDDPKLSLYSCSVSSDGSTSEKGGKFTTLHDGISYYYTVIDPKKENFSLSATFTVDYINPTPDGQEGFGIIAMDSLGENGVSSVNHYTNSASIISYKYEGWIDGVKYSSKDTLGSRFVTGLDKEVLEKGEEAVTSSASSVQEAYSYDKDDLIAKGKEYRVTLSLDNTGFHAIYDGVDHILYKGREELTKIDEDHIYLGFAVARGCNVTVSDVVLSISDPATDEEGKEAPPQLVPYSVKIESPSTSSSPFYKFTLSSNSNGRAEVVDKNSGKVLLSSFPVQKGVDVSGVLVLKEDFTSINVIITPENQYKEGDPHFASWINGRLVESEEPIVISQTIEKRELNSKTIFVSPNGKESGDGSRENPLDIYSAIKFSSPGSEIVMMEGLYEIRDRLKIERGNNGRRNLYKKLRGEGTVILDFSSSSYGMEVWGDRWILSSFIIQNTIDGKKGLQIAGNDNIVEYVTARNCGDTGIQISGSSNDDRSKWPKNNVVRYSVSHDNADSAFNNADGFAAKLTVGEGNRFYYCVAHNNADDGWDLFSKVESGPIGSVVIEKCVAYSNGILSDGRSGGDGNGFKLGGDGIGVEHLLKDSVAFNNLSNGVTSNSNPKVKVEGVISWNNWGANFTLYGKGSGERNFVLNRVVSLSGGSMDNIQEMPELLSNTTYLWNGEQSSNLEGSVIDESVFLSTSFNGFDITSDSIEMYQFLSLSPSFGLDAGL